MTVSILDLHCLNAVCDDYEDVESITAEVRKSSHGNVTDIDVADCLSELAAAGMVAAFWFDAGPSRYVPADLHEVTPERLRAAWFRITPKGHEELDANTGWSTDTSGQIPVAANHWQDFHCQDCHTQSPARSLRPYAALARFWTSLGSLA